MTKAQERIVVFAFGSVFIVALLTLAIKFPEPTRFQYEVFKVVLSLAVAGVSAMIPGFVEVNLPSWVKAGGALAVFILVMYKNPAGLIVPPPPEPVKGTVILRDGFRFFEQSGYEFASGRKVAWDAAAADILAVKQQGETTTGFFLPYDAEGYKHPNWDRNAAAGIREVAGEHPDAVRECPTDGYLHHWFQPKKGDLYCLRTRDGKHYAIIRVDAVDNDRIGFDFIFQPSGSSKF